jgi:hypothetical protein
MTAHNVITGCNTSGYFPGAGPKLAETTPPANKSFLISCSKIKMSSKTGKFNFGPKTAVQSPRLPDPPADPQRSLETTAARRRNFDDHTPNISGPLSPTNSERVVGKTYLWITSCLPVTQNRCQSVEISSYKPDFSILNPL